jgi:membrane-associated phospholipid phosphatase
MRDMQFLKENKNYFAALLLLPLVFFYLDSRVILWFRAVPKDSALYSFLQSIDPIMDVISHGVTLAIIACVLYVTGKFINIRLTEAGKYLCLGLLSTGGIVQILKHLVGRARPRFMDEALFIGPTFKGGYDSFPSGHTAAIFCFVYILSQYYPRYRILFYLYAILMALERIEGCSHFPSDVLAGALLGIIVGKLLFKMFKAEQLILPGK